MLRRYLALTLSTAACLLALCLPASAQWPETPTVNLAIADGTGEQVLPKVARTADGSSYVCWFDTRTGGYQVRLQLLSPDGVEMWAHGGIVVSTHPQSTSLVDWDLIADSSGSAVLVFTDTRYGDDLDVFAYRIGADGSFLWGPDGITLSGSDDYEPSPKVTEASDGDLVFVWSRMPNTGGGYLMMQKVSPAGELRFPVGGLVALQPGAEKPSFQQVVPAENGAVVISYVRNVASFNSLRHVRAIKISAAGTLVWGPVAVYDAASVPIAHWPQLMPDGAGGAVFCWHASVSNVYNIYVQRLDAAGMELFPHNGMPVSTNASMFHIDPYAAYDRATEEIFVLYNERNTNQSQWGVYAQKFNSAGLREWGDAGLMLRPVNSSYKSFFRCVARGGGMMGFWFEEPTPGVSNVLGMRLDGIGQSVWGSQPVAVSTVASGKGRLPIAAMDGSVVLVWEDQRSGNPDIYGQNVNEDGSLGPQIVAIDDGGDQPQTIVPSALAVYANAPNPFNPQTAITFDLPQPAHVTLHVLDLAGRQVRTLVDRDLAAARHQVVWDGSDDAGRRQPSGVYYYRLGTDERVITRKMTMIK